MLRTKATQMLLLQEEVDAQVCLINQSGILYREVAGTRKHQILECLEAYNTGARIDEENVRVFEGNLASSTPQAQLAVVPMTISW